MDGNATAAGVILTRHPEMLERAFAVAAPYMPKAAESKGLTIPASAPSGRGA